MGAAKVQGTREERIAQALARQETITQEKVPTCRVTNAKHT